VGDILVRRWHLPENPANSGEFLRRGRRLNLQTADRFGKGGGTGGFAGQDDFFVVRFTNPATSQTLEYSLADFRGSNAFIRDDWTTVDLSGLAASQLSVTLLGSRETGFSGMFFQDMPSYVAIDNLVVNIPEPHSTGLAGLFFALLLPRRRC
jgi:hypothetical protein